MATRAVLGGRFTMSIALAQPDGGGVAAVTDTRQWGGWRRENRPSATVFVRFAHAIGLCG